MSELSEHTKSDVSDHEIAIRTIAETLARCEGKENAVAGRELADRTPVSASTVRDLVPEVRERYRLPVVSCSQGYYRVASESEFVEVMERIEGRIATARERQRDITRAWYGEAAGGWSE